jgi:hypothetical protein
MSRKTAKTAQRIPILCGVVRGRGRTAQTILRGDYVLDEIQSRQVKKLFMDSARFIGSKQLKDFRLEGGEIFYENGKIAEIRMVGSLPKNEKGEYIRWSVGQAPNFTLTGDVRLLPSPQDQGRAYVLALTFRNILILSWNVEPNVAYCSPNLVDADVRFIRVAATTNTPPPWQFETGIRYAKLIIKSAKEMKMLLTQLREGVNFDGAYAYMEFCHAFMPLLKQPINDDASKGSAQGDLPIKGLGGWNPSHKLLDFILERARENAHGRLGRRRGSRTINRKNKIQERNLLRKKKILHALMIEYKKFCRKFAEADAEVKVTRVVVAERLGQARGTLHNWLRQGKFDFEDLKTEAIRRSKIN